MRNCPHCDAREGEYHREECPIFAGRIEREAERKAKALHDAISNATPNELRAVLATFGYALALTTGETPVLAPGQIEYVPPRVNVAGQAALIAQIVERIRPSVCDTWTSRNFKMEKLREGRISEFDLDTLQLIAESLAKVQQ